MNIMRCIHFGTLVIAAAAVGQTTIVLPPGPVTPGAPFSVVLTNNTPSCIDTLASNVLSLFQPTGELIRPALVGCGPVSFCLANGQSATLTYTAPASGPGSSGSFALVCPYGSGAAARLDVGAASPGFPAITTYPTAMPHGPGGHHLPQPAFAGAEWEFANTSAAAVVINPTMQVFLPGAAVPLNVAALPALLVPAGATVRVATPVGGLGPGPYTVQVDWIDPGAGGPVSVRHGIEISAGASLDLHFPGGRLVPFGGSIPARFAATPPTWTFPPTPLPYAFCVGYLPGTTTLPGGAIAPLALDALVLLSLQNGIYGLLPNNVGATVSSGVYCAHAVTPYEQATNLAVFHPNVPSLSGTVLRAAAVALDTTTSVWLASQPEEITLL